MQFQDLYAIVVTDKLKECQDFYTRWFGCQIGFESSWFVYLVTQGDRSFGLALMSHDHPSAPPGPESFSGKGVCLEFQVADATAEYARLQQGGLTISYPLRDEPWGQRRFGVSDPTGMWIDVVQQIDPAPGYWEQYVPAYQVIKPPQMTE
jgi:catechol 2,3-dioxygenase-like lactoylglutathione lyase family enzyme